MVQERLLRNSRRFLLDTNAIIYFLTGVERYLPVLIPLLGRVRDGEADMIVSAITEAELLVRPERDRNIDAIQRVGDLLSEEGVHVVEVTRPIARMAAKLRSMNRLALADAIIIATALETGCEAIVGNDREWSRRIADAPYVLLDDIAAATKTNPRP